MIRDEAIARYAKKEIERLRQESEEDLDFKIRESHEVNNIIKQGKISKRFMESDLGRFILDKATEEEQSAKDALATINLEDFTDTNKYLWAVKDLQMRAKIPALLFTWLSEAIRNAHEVDITINQEIYDVGTADEY